jgi:hypothetical protein
LEGCPEGAGWSPTTPSGFVGYPPEEGNPRPGEEEE